MMFKDCLLIGSLIIGFFVWSVAAEEEKTPIHRVLAGEAVLVPCPLAGPGSSVQWLLDGTAVVLESGREWSVSSEGRAALAIREATAKDAGLWECRELGQDGGVRRQQEVMRLHVESPPSAPHLELEGRRLLHQATVTVKEPQSLQLHCIVTGASPPVRHMHWYIGDANVTSSSELFVEYSGDSSGYSSRSLLPLNATRFEHGKEVVCRAHHPQWMQGAAVSLSLNVLYEPSFSISRDPGFGLPLVEGMRVTLECEVDANPPSSPLWVRDDPPTPLTATAGTLLFDPVVQAEHAGWYRCTTRNEVFGFFASFGYFLNVRAADPAEAHQPDNSGSSFATAGCIPDGRPEVTAVNRSLAGLSGRSALLSGQLCSTPRPDRVYWLLRHLVLRPGDNIHPYVAHNLTETDVPGCWRVVLEVVSLSVDDSGEVVLIARNPSGTADALFTLNVTHASSYHTTSHAPSSLTCPTDVFCACALLTILFPLWLRWTLDNR